MITLNPQHIIPALGGACVLTTLALASTFLVPSPPEAETNNQERTQAIAPVSVTRREIPVANEVLAKHLFVPERKAENMRSNSDLVIKGVYIGERESNLVLSLKSKPAVSLRVWEREKDTLIAKITNTKDARYPLIAFLKEWDIQKIGFSEVTFHNPLTGETEAYEVDYTPAKKVADNAIGGYGQGGVLNIGNGKSGTATRTKTGQSSQQNKTSRVSTQMASTINNRVSGLMERMSPEQRQQFANAVKKASAQQSKNNKNSKSNHSNNNNRKRN